MESIILTGAAATSTWNASPGIYFMLEGVQIDVPLDLVGTSDPSITISGAVTGFYTFHHTTDVNIKFAANEDVVFTTSNFSGEYTAVINYTKGGDMSSYMQTDNTREARGEIRYTPKFWRFS